MSDKKITTNTDAQKSSQGGQFSDQGATDFSEQGGTTTNVVFTPPKTKPK